MKNILTYFLITGLFLVFSCSSDKDIDMRTEPHEQLSNYQFFVGDIANLIPNERVVPYELNSPLFSDYAKKSRFVWMPEGTSATYVENQVLDFPEGAVLIKTFYYDNDERNAEKGRRLIETRLLVKEQQEWAAHSYIWNEEQTEAYLEVVGAIKDVNWVDATGQAQMIDYIVPNKNQCKGCHYNKGVLEPIGPKVRNLNKDFAYKDGTSNQLEKWTSLGYLKGYDVNTASPKLADYRNEISGSLHERAMAYLDINCGHCHNPNGPANTTGLNLVATAETNMALGIWKAPVAAGVGTGGFAYSIVPGKPEVSILPYRMSSTDPSAMMPELGRRMVHHDGVALIEEWIREMKPDGELRMEN